MVALGCLAVVGMSSMAFAQDAVLSKRVDLFLVDGNLEDALNLLTKQTGLEFVIEPGDKEFAHINLSLKDKTAFDAIRFICEAAGAWADRDESGVYIVRRGMKPRGTVSTTGASVAEPKMIRKIRLKHGDAETILRQIKGEVIDPLRERQEVQRVWDSARNNPLSDVPQVLYPGTSVNPGAAYPVSTSPSQAELSRNNTLRESGSDVALPMSEGGLQFGGAGQGVGGGAGFGGGQNGGGAGRGGGQNGGGQGASTITSGQGFAPEGLTNVTYDPVDNSLVVQGTDEAIRQLRNLVDLFDVVPKQVVIKVEFIETSTGVTKSLGFDWLYQRGAIGAGNTPGSFVRAGDPVFLNYATGNVTTRMRTSLIEANGRTVQAPLIRTLNNQSASVYQSTSVPIIRTTVSVSNGAIIQSPNVTYQPAQTGIDVRPRINDDGTVTMMLRPQVSGFGKTTRDNLGNEYPEFLTQAILVVARVKDRETIALGGLTNKSTTETVARFPILSDLPIVGSFFKQTTKQRNDSETIIFVTPMIVQDDENGGLTP